MNERTRSRPSRADRPARSFGRLVRADAIAIVLAIASVLVAGIVLLDGPSRVDHLTINNPTDYDLTIQLSPGPDRAWLPFAVIGLRSTREFHDVLDQGDSWEFRFRAQGRDGGAVTVSRAQLEADGWQLSVPADIVTQLQLLGAPRSPCVSADCNAPAG
jgi:hypothetical protein